jgi:hypothetical protein
VSTWKSEEATLHYLPKRSQPDPAYLLLHLVHDGYSALICAVGYKVDLGLTGSGVLQRVLRDKQQKKHSTLICEVHYMHSNVHA